MTERSTPNVSRDARAEAAERLGGRHDVRVLEPSPPAVSEPPFFADDPVAGGEVVPVDRPAVRSWHALCAEEDDAELARWCAARWLGPWPALGPLPAGFAATRAAMHALAEHVLCAARYASNGKVGLRFTKGGFGTPFFAGQLETRQARVEGTDLVLERHPGVADRSPIATLGHAAAFLGVAPGAPSAVFAPTTPGDPDAVLTVDAASSEALGAWYGFCASVLEQVRDEAPDASRVQLWPEHFDIAVDFGDAETGARANYGGSPGDAAHPEPYLYVGPWEAQRGEFWNESFGATLGYRQILGSGDAGAQRTVALDFLRRGRGLLARGR